MRDLADKKAMISRLHLFARMAFKVAERGLERGRAQGRLDGLNALEGIIVRIEVL